MEVSALPLVYTVRGVLGVSMTALIGLIVIDRSRDRRDRLPPVSIGKAKPAPSSLVVHSVAA